MILLKATISRCCGFLKGKNEKKTYMLASLRCLKAISTVSDDSI